MPSEATSSKRPTILLVEDSEDDRFFFQRALAKAQWPHELRTASDGQEALHYLGGQGSGTEAGTAPPDIIFLDLKLPKFSGFEVLKWMKERALLEKTWVVVLSGSDEQKDRAMARELGAKDYVVKPIQPDTLRAHLQVVSEA